MNEDGHGASHSNVEFGYGGQMYLNDHVVNVVLFKRWKTSTWQELLLACLFTAVMGLLYEMFVVLRELLAWKVANEAKLEGSKEEKPNDEKTKLRDESKTRRRSGDYLTRTTNIQYGVHYHKLSNIKIHRNTEQPLPASNVILPPIVAGPARHAPGDDIQRLHLPRNNRQQGCRLFLLQLDIG